MIAPSLLPSLSKNHDKIDNIIAFWNVMGLIYLSCVESLDVFLSKKFQVKV